MSSSTSSSTHSPPSDVKRPRYLVSKEERERSTWEAVELIRSVLPQVNLYPSVREMHRKMETLRSDYWAVPNTYLGWIVEYTGWERIDGVSHLAGLSRVANVSEFVNQEMSSAESYVVDYSDGKHPIVDQIPLVLESASNLKRLGVVMVNRKHGLPLVSRLTLPSTLETFAILEFPHPRAYADEPLRLDIYMRTEAFLEEETVRDESAFPRFSDIVSTVVSDFMRSASNPTKEILRHRNLPEIFVRFYLRPESVTSPPMSRNHPLTANLNALHFHIAPRIHSEVRFTAWFTDVGDYDSLDEMYVACLSHVLTNRLPPH